MAFVNIDSPVAVQVQALGWTTVVLSQGAEFADDHPVVAQFPQFFADRDAEAPVESATALPGEKRSVGKKKAAASQTVQSRANLDG